MLVGGASVNRHSVIFYIKTTLNKQTKMEREGERERKTWTLVCIRV